MFLTFHKPGEHSRQTHANMSTFVPSVDLTTNPSSSTNDDTTSPSSATRKPRFRFTTALDLLMCKAIQEKNAHAPPQNQKMKLMNEACDLFLTIIPQHFRDMYAEPKGKTISDRFELIAKQRRSDDGKTRAASGIAEERTELDMLLDDMLLQRDEVDEQRRKEREEKTEKDKKLEEASAEIRSKALSRASVAGSSEEDGIESKRKVRRVVSLDSDDEELEMMKAAIDERRENERKRLEIERERLSFEMTEARERSDKAEREHELEKKRLDIQKGELELARQKTFAEMEERKVLLSVLSGLSKKIGSSE